MFLINWFFTKKINTDLKEKESIITPTPTTEENESVKSEMVILDVSEPEHNLEIEIEKEEPIIKNVIDVEHIIEYKNDPPDDDFNVEYEGEETGGEIEEYENDPPDDDFNVEYEGEETGGEIEEYENDNKITINDDELEYEHDEPEGYELKEFKLDSTSFIPLKINQLV
jgi:hypothetical protein